MLEARSNNKWFPHFLPFITNNEKLYVRDSKNDNHNRPSVVVYKTNNWIETRMSIYYIQKGFFLFPPHTSFFAAQIDTLRPLYTEYSQGYWINSDKSIFVNLSGEKNRAVCGRPLRLIQMAPIPIVCDLKELEFLNLISLPHRFGPSSSII